MKRRTEARVRRPPCAPPELKWGRAPQVSPDRHVRSDTCHSRFLVRCPVKPPKKGVRSLSALETRFESPLVRHEDQGKEIVMRPGRLGLIATLGFSLAGALFAQSAPTHPPTSLTGGAPIVVPESPITKGPNTYGGTATSYYRVGVSEFSPANTLTTYSDLSQGSTTFSRYPTANAGSAFVARSE